MLLYVLVIFTASFACSLNYCQGSPVIDEFSPIVPESVRRLYGFDLAEGIRENRRSTREVTKPMKYDVRTNCSSNDRQPVNRINTSLRLQSLREKMMLRAFDAIIVPSSDEHQNEYVSPSDKRREFITGFSGSSGTAVITRDDNALWTDTRYTLQADQQVDCSWKIVTHSRNAPTPTKWLTEHLPNGSKIGADMRLFGANEWMELQKALNESNVLFEDIEELFDEFWDEFGGRPSGGNGTIDIHDIQFAGVDWETKVRQIQKEMKDEEADLLIVSALDEVAWLLNLRGYDIPNNPVFRSYVVLEAGETHPVYLFVSQPSHLNPDVEEHLRINRCSHGRLCVELHPYNSVKTFLEDITQRDDIKKVLLSEKHPYSSGVSYYLYSSIPDAKRTLVASPIMLRKAKKSEAEANSMKEAQVKDSVALVEFFAHIEKEIENGAQYDEISILEPLRKFRSEQEHYRGNSFQATSAFGSNGAIVHYVPSNDTKKEITDQSLYLLDSGGQYLDGTTDVTRTLHFGKPSAFQRDAYTRVLQGAIELATLVFPWGMRDIFVDIIARRPLYEAGLDYGHGTGHGIGLYLNVHEGPTLVAMNEGESSQIEVGQFFSDEPGYYKANDFGVRLESIIHVVNHPKFKDRWGHQMLKFEVVTLVPFEPKLIDQSMLTEKQCFFLNDYNEQIQLVIGNRLLQKGSKDAHEWMMEKTKLLDCRKQISGSSSNKNIGFTYFIAILHILYFTSVKILQIEI